MCETTVTISGTQRLLKKLAHIKFFVFVICYLQLKWREMITNNVSSHVFDVLWTNDFYNIMEKEHLMDALSKAVLGVYFLLSI